MSPPQTRRWMPVFIPALLGSDFRKRPEHITATCNPRTTNTEALFSIKKKTDYCDVLTMRNCIQEFIIPVTNLTVCLFQVYIETEIFSPE